MTDEMQQKVGSEYCEVFYANVTVQHVTTRFFFRASVGPGQPDRMSGEQTRAADSGGVGGRVGLESLDSQRNRGWHNAKYTGAAVVQYSLFNSGLPSPNGCL